MNRKTIYCTILFFLGDRSLKRNHTETAVMNITMKRNVGKILRLYHFTWRFACFNIRLQKTPLRAQVTTKFKTLSVKTMKSRVTFVPSLVISCTISSAAFNLTQHSSMVPHETTVYDICNRLQSHFLERLQSKTVASRFPTFQMLQRCRTWSNDLQEKRKFHQKSCPRVYLPSQQMWLGLAATPWRVMITRTSGFRTIRMPECFTKQ